MGTRMGRRDFLKGAALSAAGIAGMGALAGCAAGSGDDAKNGAMSFDQSIAWDGQYDVVVVGFGAAGAVTSITAADNGASVLLLDKAPEGHEGGNTRYCGQFIATGKGDLEKTRTYYRALYGTHKIDEGVFNAYTEGVANSLDLVAETLGIDKSTFVISEDGNLTAGASMSPEYPEFPGSDTIRLFTVTGTNSDSHLWKLERQAVVDRKDQIDVWLESPATKLIQDPQTKTILGVAVEREGEKRNIRANNGVVLTCGGFENNPDMMRDYCGIKGQYGFEGTPYNTGDGVLMAIGVGADLWHMHSYEGSGQMGGSGYITPEGEQSKQIMILPFMGMGKANSFLTVGKGGTRFLREDESTRHGKIATNGIWSAPSHPDESFVIWDGKEMTEMEAGASASSYYAVAEHFQDQIVEAGSIPELANALGIDPDTLARTVDEYNQMAAAGADMAFHRKALAPLDDVGPYYGLPIAPSIINTQGGPRRNAEAEVLDVEGTPIPHLYSAGECGGAIANMYQGGGNMAECITFGRIAGKNAAAKKDDLSPFVLEAAESNIVYTLGKETDIGSEETYETADNEHIGKSSNGMGGEIVVKVVMDGSTIAGIEILKETETPDVGGAALKKLPGMVVEAQSTDIDAVSGATVTSTAFAEAVAEALAQA